MLDADTPGRVDAVIANLPSFKIGKTDPRAVAARCGSWAAEHLWLVHGGFGVEILVDALEQNNRVKDYSSGQIPPPLHRPDVDQGVILLTHSFGSLWALVVP